MTYALPLIIRDGEPCGIAAALLVDDGVEKDAFEAEAEAQSRTSRGRVERVALPLIAPISELIEGVAHHQILKFRGGASLLQLRRQMDVADLDGAVLRRDAQQGADAGRVGAFIEEGEKERVAAGGVVLEPAAPLVSVGRR